MKSKHNGIDKLAKEYINKANKIFSNYLDEYTRYSLDLGKANHWLKKLKTKLSDLKTEVETRKKEEARHHNQLTNNGTNFSLLIEKIDSLVEQIDQLLST